jgi:hypothetical protein
MLAARVGFTPQSLAPLAFPDMTVTADEILG